MSFLKSWDDEQKANAVRIVGLCVAAFTIFVLVATLSYLFHWEQDMSVLMDGNATGKVGNTAGQAGLKMGHLLVGELFGLGSFALLIILTAVSIRLVAHKWHSSLMKTLLIALFGAVIASLTLAYIGGLLSLDYVFGGGLGGRCGARMVLWAENLIGVPVTGVCIVVLILSFLFLSSRRFGRWFEALGTKPKEKKKSRKEKSTEKVKVENLAVEESDSEEDAKDEADSAVMHDEAVTAQDAEAEDELTGRDAATEPEPAAGGSLLQTAAAADAAPAGEVVDNAVRPMAAHSCTDGSETRGDDAEGSFEIVSGEPLSTDVTEPLKPIDNRLDPPDGLPGYVFPSIELLKSHSSGRRDVSNEELTRNNNKIRAALANYKIQVRDVKAIVGPTVTLYKVYPAPGVKIAEIKKLQEDIAMSLNANGVRVSTLADSVGIEVANDFKSIVPLKALLNDDEFRESKAKLPVAIGYTITQKVKVFDLSDAPHLLIAGATKQGKSVGLNVIVSSLLYSKHPSELKFVFIDPKMVEFSPYSKLLKHYLAVLPEAASEEEEMADAIVKEPKKAEKILRSLCLEMDERYKLLSTAGVNEISKYNEKYKERHLRPDKGHRFLPYIVVVIDEYADLTMTQGASPETKTASRSITNSIIRLAQKGRAAGLHVILATQRPSVDVISGVIKSNFPMRIAFRVATRVDSATIIDNTGAEKLIGRGDMLFYTGVDTERIQCALVDGDEVEAVTKAISSQTGYGKCYNTPYYLPEVTDPGAESKGEGNSGSLNAHSLDDRFVEAAKMVVTTQKGSTSDLQRRLGMGYTKAGRVMDQLEEAGIVGPQEGSKPRQVIVSDLDTLQQILDSLGLT